MTTNKHSIVLGLVAIILASVVAFPAPASATVYTTGTPLGASDVLWGTKPCCGTFSTPATSYKAPATYSAKYPTSYGYGFAPSYGYDTGGDLNFAFTYNKNTTKINNTTNNTNNLNTNVNGNNNYIGGVAASNETNTDISARSSIASNQPAYIGGAGASTSDGWYYTNHYIQPTYVGGAGGSSAAVSTTGGSNGTQSNNTNINFNNGSRGTTTVHDTNDNEDAPTCDLSLSDSSIEDGDDSTLRWDTSGNVDSASINQGIGSVNENGGSKRVSPSDDTTYRMTVRGPGGSDTCSVTLNVSGSNNNNDFSSAVFTDEPPQNPTQTVYLSSIPYTGLEDITPELMAYWLLLIAGAGGLAWFLMQNGFIPNVLAFRFAGNATMRSEEVEEAVEEETVADTTTDFVNALRTDEKASALDYLRTAAVDGTGVEDFLTSARMTLADADPLASRFDAAIAEAKQTGIRGAKIAFGF